MAAFATYSTNPDVNITVNGKAIGEGCPAGNVNDVLRVAFAEGRQLYDIVSAINISGYMPKSGGAFTGSVTQSGAGAYSYYADSSLASGIEYVQPSTTALPSSPAEGTKVYQF